MKSFRNRTPAWKKEKARQYRRNPTLSESKFWQMIRHGVLGYRWRRQTPILGYIVDFWCPRLALVIELDGSMTHDKDWDTHRDLALSEIGIKTLRIPSRLMFKDAEGVYRLLVKTMRERLNPDAVASYGDRIVAT